MRLGDQRLVLDDQHGDRVHRAAPDGHGDDRSVGHVGGQRAAVALHHLRDQAPGRGRAARLRRRRLRGIAALHGPLERLGVHARSAVGHADQQLAVVLAHRHLHPRIVTVARVHRVVDQVAEHRDHLLRRQRHVAVSDGRWVSSVIGQRDATLVGLRGLAEQQRHQRGLADVAATAGPPVVATAPARRWRTATASSGRPISTIVITVCSLLAASWACDRSDSVSTCSELSSPSAPCNSVRSRTVTTSECAGSGDAGPVDHQHPFVGDVHLVARAGVVGAQELRQIRLRRPGPAAARAVGGPRR